MSIGPFDFVPDGSILVLLPFDDRYTVPVTQEQLCFMTGAGARCDFFGVVDGGAGDILAERISTGERCLVPQSCFRYASPLEMLAAAADDSLWKVDE